MAGEQVPAPPPQAAMEATAPSTLCPSACHQAQVCRCGEAYASAGPAPKQPEEQQAPNNVLTLSAAMFPEMGMNPGT